MSPPPDTDSPGFDPRLVRALDHPVRAAFLKLLAQRGCISPAEALPLLGGAELGLSNVVYHARVLEYFELIEPAGEPERQQGLPFRPTPAGEAAMLALGLSSQGGSS
jgi:hypothetical protein